jgi:inhibitor of KinA sporulation pathway (predicted exonuclease)
LVVDLEATCDDGGLVPRADSEIIEIGAVLVDGLTLRTVGEFQTFVRPVVHPKLTPFCTELTTITQADVDAAPTFPAVAARLAAFGAGTLFCSWGAYDRNQLEADARRHGVPPPLGPHHMNIKEVFARAAGASRAEASPEAAGGGGGGGGGGGASARRGRGGSRTMGNRSVLARVGVEPTGTHHRGIDDARNIARLLPYALGRVPIPAAGRREEYRR